MTKESDCRHVHDAIQNILDGAASALPPELDAHRRQCRDCQSIFAAAMQLGQVRFSKVEISAQLTDRFVAAVIADRATPARVAARWQRVAIWAAVAAVLLIGAGVGLDAYFHTPPSKVIATTLPRQSADKKPESGSLDFRENLASASDALLSLTRRTTGGVIEPTKDLFSFDVEAPWLTRADGLPGAIDPAVQSLEEVRNGAAAGFEPMATTARRAFAMFTRDLPIDRTTKPGS